MKIFKTVIFTLIACLLFVGNNFGQSFEIVKESQLNHLLGEIRSNEDSLFEYMTAKKFHKKINDYRLKNKRDTLEWSDVLWIAARNHTIYMMVNKRLTHFESLGKKFFTGKDPEARLIYVQDKGKKFMESGENVLINSFSFTEFDENNAEQLAQEAFELWENSKDHRENMIYANFRFHGTSFIIQDGVAYSTDLFAAVYYDPNH